MLLKITERSAVLAERLTPRTGLDRLSRAKQALDWLERAHTAVDGKGVSVGYHAGRGWLAPYPEVSGYLLCTLRVLADAEKTVGAGTAHKAEIIATATTRWLADELYVKGHGYRSFDTRHSTAELVFDTGQVLHGLVSMAGWKPESCAAEKIADISDWLCQQMDPDGGWTRGTFWGGQAEAYYLRVTWALVRAGRLLNDRRLLDRARLNFHFFLKHSSTDHWDGFLSRGIREPYLAILHFLAYTVQSAVECGAAFENDGMTRLAERMLDWLADSHLKRGGLPGRIDRSGKPDRSFRCVTGEFQTALSFYRYAMVSGKRAYQVTGDEILERALEISSGNAGTPSVRRGGVWGSEPVFGRYQPWTQISWGAKFLIDAVLAAEECERPVSEQIRKGELA